MEKWCEKATILKKMKMQLNKNPSCLNTTASFRQTTPPSSPAWKRPIYLKFLVLPMWVIF